ncbi:MAG: extracellular solute-binding protein [bacterium]|nr:extracellular solute-binding protein [bacterium]
MKKLSKFQIILLIVFGAFAISGVLIFAFAVGGTGSNGVGPVTVWGTVDAPTFNAVVRQASETTAGLSQVTYTQHDPATYEDDLTNAIASGTGPDLFIISQDYAVKNAGKIYSIPFSSFSQEQFESTFIESANPFFSQNLQAVLAIPFVADPLVMYWNRDLLSASGYAKPPTYWDEIVPMATYVNGGSASVNQNAVTKRDDANSIKKSAIAFGEYANVSNAKDILATLIMQAGGTITAIDNSNHLIPALSARTGDTQQSSESALRFYTGFANPSKNDYSWNRSLAESRAAFAAGDLGLYVGYASEDTLIRRMNPNLNFAPALLPQIRGGNRTITYAHVYGFAIARGSKNPVSANTVAYLLVSTQVSKALATVLGLPSARRDVLAQKTVGDSEVFNRAAIISRSWIDPDPEKTNGTFRVMIENTTSGASSVSEAVQRADQELAHILGL